MCGHVGMAGHLEHKDELAMKKFLIYDFFRGPDSTGFAALKKDNTTLKIAKIASHPLDLFEMKRFTEALNGFQSQVFLGHNRLATKGVINNANAHPYQFDHIVGAHNGTLDKKSWDKMNELAGEDYPVDSQAIFAAIAKVGIEAVVPHLEGAWALVWIDLSAGTMNFLRNKERPLWFAYQEDFKKILWASEWQFIDMSIKGAMNEYKLYKNETGHSFFTFKENWWYRFELDKLKAGSTEKPKPRVKELKGKEPTPVAKTHYHQGTAPFSVTGPKTGSTTGSQNSTAASKILELIEITGTKTKPLGDFMKEPEFNLLVKGGCAWCGEAVEYDQPGIEINTVLEYVLCPDHSSSKGDEQTRVMVHGDELDLMRHAA